VYNDIAKRKRFAADEMHHHLLKSLQMNQSANRYDFNKYFHGNLHMDNAKRTKLPPMCVKSGRIKGLVKRFKMNRMQFKEMASAGMLPGVRPYSW